MSHDKKIQKKSKKVKFIFIFSTLMLSGCATNYTKSTNLDKDNFQNYFSHTQVKIVADESEFSGRYKLIGMVEGQNCQAKPHHAAPDKIAARTQARRQAFKQKANAIIFTGCALIDDNQANKKCHATIVCYGKAYQVEQTENE
jgi:RcsF protein